MKNKKKSVLLKNTVMLYFLTFSNYLFSFITVPYQTRILGVEVYGELGFAQALMVYIQLFLDFGFILSSTEDVSRHRDDSVEMSRIMSAVLICKVLLGLISFGFITVLCFSMDRFRQNMLVYQLFFLSTFFNCLLPDFLYRGVEKMSAITYRAVAIKLFFTVAIFVLLKDKEQFYLIPLLNTLGGLGACIWTYYDAHHSIGVKFVRVSKGYVWNTLRRSSGYFVSRIASTVYSATNTVIVGFVYPSGNTLGSYTSAEKLVTTARSAFSPIADSLYPYMVKNKDYRLVKRIMLVLMPIVALGCCFVGIYAEEFCVLLFGQEFEAAGNLLRLLMPVVFLSLPSYVFGFPVLSPLGLGKYANISVVIGAIFHALVIVGLFIADVLTVESICIATCITESIVLGIRVYTAARGWKKCKEQNESDLEAKEK